MNQDVAVVGLDLAKRVFQVHAISADGAVVAKRKLRRSEVLPFFCPCRHALLVWKPAHPRITGGVRRQMIWDTVV